MQFYLAKYSRVYPNVEFCPFLQLSVFLIAERYPYVSVVRGLETYTCGIFVLECVATMADPDLHC